MARYMARAAKARNIVFSSEFRMAPTLSSCSMRFPSRRPTLCLTNVFLSGSCDASEARH